MKNANKITLPNGETIALVSSVATDTDNGLMSAADKSKLDNIAANANNYSHPTYTNKSSGLYKITVDNTGHVSGTSAVSKTDITNLGIPGTNTTYNNATTSAAGLMSAADKTKLDGINITSGTAAPSDSTGNNGDIYIQIIS